MSLDYESYQTRSLNPTTAPPDGPEPLVPAPKVAEQFGVTRRTLGRWIVDAKLDFPRPIELNRRLYFPQAEIERWKSDRARRSVVAAACSASNRPQ